MDGNHVAKYAYRFNKAKVYRVKTKTRPPKRLTARELYEYEEERGDLTSTNFFHSKING